MDLLWMEYSINTQIYFTSLSLFWNFSVSLVVFSQWKYWFLLFTLCLVSSGWMGTISFNFPTDIIFIYIHSSQFLWLLFPQPVEGANEFLHLLKSHKEKLEEGMRELRRRNGELERERDEGEKERERMRRCIEQLRAKLAQAQVTWKHKQILSWNSF